MCLSKNPELDYQVDLTPEAGVDPIAKSRVNEVKIWFEIANS